jgi:hypothetical protein
MIHAQELKLQARSCEQRCDFVVQRISGEPQSILGARALSCFHCSPVQNTN